MAEFMNRFLNYIGIEAPEIEGEYQDEYQEDHFEEPDNVVSFRPSENKRRNGNVVTMPAAMQMKMIVYHPVSYEDTQNIIDNLKSRKPVIVNMEDLEVDCAQRILDFMSGAVYALSGTIFKISRGIFVVAPVNCDIIGNGDGDLGDGGRI